MLYSQYDGMKLLMSPFAHYLERSLVAMDAWDKMFPDFAFLTNGSQARFALTHNLIKYYPKLAWGIKPVEINGVSHEVHEEVVKTDTFCELRLFSVKAESGKERKALFMVAPLSGHYATLLRDTVQTFVKDFDVYVTDWLNPRDIPRNQGDFGFDDYVMYVINYSKFIRQKHSQVNALAVCQPTVPVVAANAYLAKTEPEYQFDRVVLMGGPLDTRESPTQVNKYAMKHDLNWFKNNVIKTVPVWYSGAGRSVYPGYLQHFGFLSMNMKRHTQAHIDFFNHLLKGADLEAKKHEDFYDEYNAVMDLPAKYYLETLDNVFIDQKLAKGTMMVNGVQLSMADINKGNYLLLEGELDDISGKGQTHAAYDLMTGLDNQHKNKVVAREVGHYGIFSGSGFRNNVYPVLKTFLYSEELDAPTKAKSKVEGDTLFIDKNKRDETELDLENKIAENVTNSVEEVEKSHIAEVIAEHDHAMVHENVVKSDVSNLVKVDKEEHVELNIEPVQPQVTKDVESKPVLKNALKQLHTKPEIKTTNNSGKIASKAKPNTKGAKTKEKK